MVFELPNLTTSDTVNIDAVSNDNNLNAVFIMKGGCGQPLQCSRVVGDQSAFDFTPASDGTYYVVIDKTTQSSGPFSYTFTYK